MDMKELKEYSKPTAREMEVGLQGIIATSGLKYSNESADKDYEVLASKNRGEWGNVWK